MFLPSAFYRIVLAADEKFREWFDRADDIIGGEILG
jgi:hypothetical protein